MGSVLRNANNIILSGVSNSMIPNEEWETNNLDNIRNISQLELDEILERISENPKPSDEDQQNLVIYILKEFKSQEKFEFTEEEVTTRYTDLVIGYTMRKLSAQGLLDVFIDDTGEPLFELSEKGKEAMKNNP
jgi:hypothetical protein